MNKMGMPFAGSTWVTSQGLMREKRRTERSEKRSRSKTVSEGRDTISKTISRSSEESRSSSSSSSPELPPTLPVKTISVEDLPALPDSVPATPGTKTLEAEISGTPTPRPTPSAGAVSQFLQPFVEDATDIATPKQEIPQPNLVKEEIVVEKVPEQASEPGPFKSPLTEKSKALELAPILTSAKPTTTDAQFRYDHSEPATPTDTESVSSRSSASTETEDAKSPKAPSVAPSVARSERSEAPKSEASKPEAPKPQQPPQSLSSSGTLVQHPHYHPAHGIPQPFPFNTQLTYPGYQQQAGEGRHTPSAYQHSPGFGPLVSYSPVPGMHPYAHVHGMSLVPANQYPQPYAPQPGMDMAHAPPPPAPSVPPMYDRGGSLASTPQPASFLPESDDAIISRIAGLLPDIQRLVNNQRLAEKAEMKALRAHHDNEKKAMRAHYERIIDQLSADKSSILRSLDKAKLKAEQAEAFLLENARLVSENRAIIGELDGMHKEKLLFLQSREAMMMTHSEHEKAIADLKRRLESERSGHENSLRTVAGDNLKALKASEEVTSKLRSEINFLTTDRNNRIRDSEAVKSELVSKTGQLESKVRELELELERSRSQRSSISRSNKEDSGPPPTTTRYQLERSTSVSSQGGQQLNRDTGVSSSRNPQGVNTNALSREPRARSRSRERTRPSTSALPVSAYEMSNSNSSSSTPVQPPPSSRRTNPSQVPSSHRASFHASQFLVSNNTTPSPQTNPTSVNGPSSSSGANNSGGRGDRERVPGGYDYYEHDPVTAPGKMERTTSSRSHRDDRDRDGGYSSRDDRRERDRDRDDRRDRDRDR